MDVKKLEELRCRLITVLEEGQKLKIETQNYIYEKNFSYTLKETSKLVEYIRRLLKRLLEIKTLKIKIDQKETEKKVNFPEFLTEKLKREAKGIVISEIKAKDPIDIVIEYNLPPNEVKKLYEIVHRQAKRRVLLNMDISDDILMLFLLASIITALDIITTRVALLHPNVYELNPVMKYLMTTLGVECTLLINIILSFIGLVVLTILSVRLNGYVKYVPLIIYSILRLIPVISNYKMLLHISS